MVILELNQIHLKRCRSNEKNGEHDASKSSTVFDLLQLIIMKKNPHEQDNNKFAFRLKTSHVSIYITIESPRPTQDSISIF